MPRNWENSCSLMWSPWKIYFLLNSNKSSTVLAYLEIKKNTIKVIPIFYGVNLVALQNSNEWQKQALIYKTWIIEAHPFP